MILLDFHATWCEPCKWSRPVIEEVMKRLEGRVVLKLVDIDLQPDLAAQFAIRSVPTFVLTNGDREVWRMNGFDTANKMAESILAAMEVANK